VVNTQNANLRAGPGTVYDALGSYPQGTALVVTGKNAAGDWLQVQAPDGKTGWMASSLLTVNTNLSQVAVAAAPPTPTPAARVDGDMVYVPAGDFIMGSQEGQGDSDERPQHTVYLDAFYIDKTEVTAAQYQSCVEAGVCSVPRTGGSCNYGAGGKSDHPINCVDWNQAAAFCSWAEKRLPTEAEWEKAARGTDGRAYPWGNQTPDATLANFSRNAGYTSSVGQYPTDVSPYGVLDMAGNVSEWVADWYSDSYYSQSPGQNPTGPSSGGDIRTTRGGSWSSDVYEIRVAYRADRLSYDKGHFNGFRCARSP
jgi:formylglycine-generating enzyme required for sulfatase activity